MTLQDSSLRVANAEVDWQLVEAVARGSGDALGKLYDRYAPTAYGLARRMLPQPDQAEEVVQDVFAQVWRDARRYERGRASVAGWIVMLTRTRAIDRLRARRARPDQASGVAPDLVAPLASPDRSPEAITISTEDVEHVRAALGQLPDNQRALVELAYYEGMTHSEIAERTGVPLGTVKTRLRAGDGDIARGAGDMTTMPAAHGEFGDAVAACALGALDPAEKQAFEAHLATCAACQAELRDMRRVVAGIGQATAPVAPPEGLKARVLASAMAQEQRGTAGGSPGLQSRVHDADARHTSGLHDRATGTPWSALALAASLVLAIGAGIYAWSLRTQVLSLRQTVTESSAQIASLRTDLATARRDAATLKTTIRVLSAPDLIQVNLKGQETAPNAIARGFWSRAHGIVFQAEGLPTLDLSKVYQLWVIKGDKVNGGGTFSVDANGSGTIMVAAAQVPEAPDAIAVSLERGPTGASVREGPIVLLGSSQK